METTRRSWFDRALDIAKTLFWIFLIYLGLQQMCAPSRVVAARAQLLDQFQQQRQSRVIAMIHRQEVVSLLGVPVGRSIGIEDSEAVLRVIRLTPSERPIDLVLHTPGGLVLAAEQISRALLGHKGKVTVFVPHYAMSGGTLIALTADEIVMDPNAVLGPTDPQIGNRPAASIVRAVEQKGVDKVDDDTLILADMSQKARLQVSSLVVEILSKRQPLEKATAIAAQLTEGRWTHDYPITADAARELGLPVTTKMPPVIYQLMDLYPQSGSSRPSVLYVPLRPRPGAADEGR
jgi:ClpP class serine protease